MGGERGSKGEGRSAGDNCADFTVFHWGLPCLPLLTSKLFAPAQSALSLNKVVFSSDASKVDAITFIPEDIIVL